MSRFSIVLLASASILGVSPALAQETATESPASTPELPAGNAASAPESEASREAMSESEEISAAIVVTAQRRVERLQDVPIAISVVSGEQLERQQISQISDLSRSTASLQFGSTSGQGGGAFVRGIGTAALTRAAESAVGIVVDGVVQGNTNISNLFDIARVEVLRGPQGTLFGQSVSAGVINVTTLVPDPSEYAGKVTAEISADGFAGSDFGRQILRGGLNVPVSENSAIRFSGYGGRTAGVLRNALFDEDDELVEAGLRGRYMGEFGGRVTVNLIGDYNYNRGEDGQFFTYIAPGGIGAALTACGVVPRLGNLDHCSSQPEITRYEVFGGSGQVDMEFGSMTLTSITAHRQSEHFVSQDIDRQFEAPGVDVRSGVLTDYQQFTQELRLASDRQQTFSFTLGGFYYHAETAVDAGPQQGQRVILPNGFTLGTVERNVTISRNLSGFGEARFHAGPFTAFAGARLTHSKITHEGIRQNVTLIGPIPNGQLLATDHAFRDTDLSWRVGAQYEPWTNLMVYGTVATGYKNAQVSPILVVNNVPILERVVLPEEPTVYELGVKSTLLGGRLALSGNGFYQKIENLQAQTFVTTSDSPVPQLLPANVSEVVSKGFEADAFGRIGRNLTLNASAVYNIAKYPADYTDALGVPLEGEQIAFAPRFAAVFSGEYVRPLGGIEAFLSLNSQYKSRTRLSDQRVAEQFTVDRSRWTFGGRLGARVEDRWSIALFVNNIGKSTAPVVLFPALLGTPSAFYTSQSLRQVGLQGSLDF